MPRAAKTTENPVALPLIGGQLSSAGGWSQIVGRALAAGAEVVQVFSSNPRIWPSAPPDAAALAQFGAALREHHLPLFLHSIYLINPASPDERLRARSILALAHSLQTGLLAGAAGVVTHLGSHRGEGFAQAAPWIAQTARAAWAAAARTPRPPGSAQLPPLLLETSAGSGATVGHTWDELQTLLELLTPAADDTTAPRVGLCLDTAHMFAAGHAIHEAAGLASLVADLDRRNLLRRVQLVHLNDSASLFASKRDRHADPGKGELGYAALARVVRQPAFRQIPFVLEVPGPEGHGPTKAEIDLVKTMRRVAAGQPAPPAEPGSGPAGPK